MRLSNNTKFPNYLDGVLRGQLEPVLTYEKLWPGLYCDKFTDIKEINNYYGNLTLLSTISNVICVLQFVLILSILLRFISKILELLTYFNVIQILILLLSVTCFILSVFFFYLCFKTSNFFIQFQTKCQIDSSNINIKSNKVGPLEKEMLNQIQCLTIFSLVLSIFDSLIVFYILFIIISKLKCTTIQEDGAGDTSKRDSVLSRLAF